MADASQAVQDWYTERLREYFSRRYRAHLRNESREEESNELGRPATEVPREGHGGLPEEIRAAYAYYREHFEETDLGSARVYRVAVGRKPIDVLRVTTDGDDGFLEAYDKNGTFLAASRRYLEVVAWGSREWLREQATHPWDLPPELQDAARRTLWGKPVEGLSCNASCAHECSASPPGRCPYPRGHLEAHGSQHLCSECSFRWGGEPPAAAASQPTPWEVTAYCTDGDKRLQKIAETHITIATKHGKVSVPVAAIRQIDFAARGRFKKLKRARKSDVIRTADAKYTGTIKSIRAWYAYSTSPLDLAELKQLRAPAQKEV